MKFIAFALAAVAFSGSSRSKDKTEPAPAEPAPAEPAPAEPAKLVPEPQPEPLPVPPNPEPAFQLSDEEKQNPKKTFAALKDKANKERDNLILLKSQVEIAKMALKDAWTKAHIKEEATKAAQKEWSYNGNLNKSQEEKARIKQVLLDAREAEAKAFEDVETRRAAVIKAKTVYNEQLDKLTAAAHELGSKGLLLVQRANEMAELSKVEAEEASETLKASEKELEKRRKIKKNIEEYLDFNTPASIKDAEEGIAKAEAQLATDEADFETKKNKAVQLSKAAKVLEQHRSRSANFWEHFFKLNTRVV